MSSFSTRLGAMIAACAVLAGSVHAQWTVTRLHPAGLGEFAGSEARGASGATQVGNAFVAGSKRASLWSGSAASWVNLDPIQSVESMALGASSANQVGWAEVGGRRRASLWSGTRASWVDLNPAGALQSQALDVWGGNQVGWMYDGAVGRASLWSGTADSWVDLHPDGAAASEAWAASPNHQAGRIFDTIGRTRASLWSGTAESWVSLDPAGSQQSEARGAWGSIQAGVAEVNGVRGASLWRGTAESWVDLHRAESLESELYDTFGKYQVGAVETGGFYHASVWTGTADSWEDLHSVLSADFRTSYALAVSSDDINTYVAGLGYNFVEGRFEALLWTLPDPAAPCDFNGDETCNITDLNTMFALGPIAGGVTMTPGVNDQFDLTGDGVIDNADADLWLADAATIAGFGSPYKRGDANLDGVVDGQDFIVWNGSKFTDSLLWSAGNFNADGVVDGQDFIVWNGNKFTSSDAVSAVPEPAAGMLLVVLGLTGVVIRRR